MFECIRARPLRVAVSSVDWKYVAEELQRDACNEEEEKALQEIEEILWPANLAQLSPNHLAQPVKRTAGNTKASEANSGCSTLWQQFMLQAIMPPAWCSQPESCCAAFERW